MACDVCFQPCANLVTLRDIYQTRSIKAVCPSCERRVNKALARIRRQQISMLIAFMEHRRDRASRMRSGRE